MRAAMRYYEIMICVWMIIVMTGCGKSRAEEILLEDSGKSQTEALQESETDIEPKTTEAPIQPIINVVCNCQCQGVGQVSEASQGAVPSEGQTVPDGSGSEANGKVNINTADITALTTLNGIGEVRAQAIISHREAYGAFQTIEDLKNVNGIKDGVYNKIKDDISVG